MCFVSIKKYRALMADLLTAQSEIGKLKQKNTSLDVEVNKYKADAEAYSLDADIEREKCMRLIALLDQAEATEKQLRSDYATLLRKAYLRDGRKFVKAVKVAKAEGVE